MQRVLTERFLNAIKGYFDAVSERDDAKNTFIAEGGYDWGYFGYSYDSAVAAKTVEFEQEMLRYFKALMTANAKREDEEPK